MSFNLMQLLTQLDTMNGNAGGNPNNRRGWQQTGPLPWNREPNPRNSGATTPPNMWGWMQAANGPDDKAVNKRPLPPQMQNRLSYEGFHNDTQYDLGGPSRNALLGPHG